MMTAIGQRTASVRQDIFCKDIDMDKDQRDLGSPPAPMGSGLTTLLHWALFLGLMTALIGGAAILF